MDGKEVASHPGSALRTHKVSIETEIRRLEFDTRSALRVARKGKIEVWVHQYLLAGQWANPAFSEGLKLQKRWWNGPVEVNLSALSRVVGPEPGMEYPVGSDYWSERTSKMAKSMTDPLSIPPLIVEYRSGQLRVSDGNTRQAAMSLLGWPKCWVIIWYNTESDFLQHGRFFPGSSIT